MVESTKPFQIWGDYGYTGETLIIDFDDEWAARDFFSDSVLRGEYDEDHELIELAVFQGEEYVPILRYDVEKEDEGVLADEW